MMRSTHRFALLALSALLVACAFPVLAQDTVDDGTQAVNDAMKEMNEATKAAEQDAMGTTNAAEQDAGAVLGDRARPPDPTQDTPPEGVQQTDNAGSANFSTHSEGHSETVTEGSSSGTSAGFGNDSDRMPRAGEIANNPPPRPAGPATTAPTDPPAT